MGTLAKAIGLPEWAIFTILGAGVVLWLTATAKTAAASTTAGGGSGGSSSTLFSGVSLAPQAWVTSPNSAQWQNVVTNSSGPAQRPAAADATGVSGSGGAFDNNPVPLSQAPSTVTSLFTQ